MKRCNNCKLDFSTNRYTCPFCKNLLEEKENDGIETITQHYPLFKDKIYKINVVHKIFFFLSIVTILTVIITNYHEYKKGINSLWSIITLAAILTLWSLVYGLIISKKNAARRIFNFGFSLIILILSIEYCSITNKGNYINWSLSYVIPLILIATLSAINLMVIIRRKRFTDFVGYQFWISLSLILYHLLYIFDVHKVRWASLCALLYGLATIIAIFFFGGKKTKEEIKKRFTL